MEQPVYVNPHDIKGMIAAADRFTQAVSKGEAVVFVGDYDVDGVNSSAMVKRIGDYLGLEIEVRLPRRYSEGYGLSENYCGAGLVFKLAEILIDDKEFLDRLSVLACIATIADVVPLYGDNRVIVKQGFRAVRAGRSLPGITALIDKVGVYESCL